MQKLRVGVLMGGKSVEREVSFNSGRTICDHLDTTRYEIVPLFQTHDGTLYLLPWHFLHRGKISDFVQRLAHEAQTVAWDDLKNIIDFVYIAVHGRFAEDGTLQGLLEILGIPYLGSGVFSSALSMDKIRQKIFLRNAGIAVPNDLSLPAHKAASAHEHKDAILADLIAKNISFPCVVKPFQEGSSLGIQMVHSAEALCDAIVHACTIDATRIQDVLIEEKIEGMEFSCIILTDYRTGNYIPLPPTEIVPEKGTDIFDYEQKYMPGRATKFTPPRCEQKIIDAIHQACFKTMQALNMTTIGRIDGFVRRDGSVVIVDPNTLSGMAPNSFFFREAAEIGMGHTQLINHLIETELEQYGMLHAIEQAEQAQEKKEQTKKIRIAVLMGGNSNEREISLESGRNIAYKLSPHKYEALPIFVSDTMQLFLLTQAQLVRNSTKEIAASLTQEQHVRWQDLPIIADFVFIGLHGGAGENGSVQGTLEMLGMPYNGSSVLASALCMDKYKTNEFLLRNGFEIPQHILVEKAAWQTDQKNILSTICARIPFPIIVKPHDDGCSVMVQKARSEKDLADAINTLFANEKTSALIEECIMGMELTVGVLGNEDPRALPPSQALSAADILSMQEKFLPGAGENQTPAPLSQKATQLVQRTMERVYAAVGCAGYARIDCFYQTQEESPAGIERVVIIEINTLPGMTPATCIFHQAAEIGIKPMDFVDQIVQLGMKNHAHPQVASVPKTASI